MVRGGPFDILGALWRFWKKKFQVERFEKKILPDMVGEKKKMPSRHEGKKIMHQVTVLLVIYLELFEFGLLSYYPVLFDFSKCPEAKLFISNKFLEKLMVPFSNFPVCLHRSQTVTCRDSDYQTRVNFPK